MKAAPYDPKAFRVARDSMGEMLIPKDAMYGASTQRAVLNFPVSGRRFPRSFIYALGQIKLSAAKVNCRLKGLSPRFASAIAQSAKEVRDGKWDSQFVLDIFQTGSGTSTNMNANEVIAYLANRKLGLDDKSPKRVHPNDHVNQGQSSNDVIPTAIHVAALLRIRDGLLPECGRLSKEFARKSRQFEDIFKVGRTHLQDATPITLGQEFAGYAEQMRKAGFRLKRAIDVLRELPLGGTAVGTGINTHPKFADRVISDMNAELSERFYEAEDHFEAQSAKDACVEASGELKSVAVSLTKIANDLRWLSCGPRAGIAEIRLPATQPGSSIMPGKVNPVIPEAVLQVAAEVIGNDLSITLAGQSGVFELNVMMPLIAHKLLESIELLTNVVKILREKCVSGIEADRKACESQIEKSLMLSTPLVPVLGYDRAAELAKEAYTKAKSIRQVVLERKLIAPDELDRLLDVRKMV